MKKLLLSCFLALGIGAHAQYNYTAGFEEDEEQLGIYGQFSTGTITSAAACAGSWGGQLAFTTTTTQTGWMVRLTELGDLTGQSGNGQKIDVSAKYKKAAGFVGTVQLAYMELIEGTTWNVVPFGTAVSLSNAAITTCNTISATIPAGTIQPTGKTYGIGVWFMRSSGSGNVYVDDISFVQETISAVPACATVTYPTAGSTVDAGNVAFTWNAVPTAVNYKLTIGTTSGGTDILDTVVTGTTRNVSLAPGTTYYAKVVPSNGSGDAVGCSEFSFTTGSAIAYCGPLTTNQPTNVFTISSVEFAGITKTSEAPGTFGNGLPPHQFFTDTIIDTALGVTYPITVKGAANGVASNGWAMTVFIDWNGDGDFDDAGESFFNTAATMIRVANSSETTITLTGNIPVPMDAKLGETRMRVKYNFSGTTLHTALESACSQMGNGQAEDYTLHIVEPPIPDCVAITSPANGATNVPLPTTLTWEANMYASQYKVYVGTTAGATDILPGIPANGTSFEIPAGLLERNTQYFAKIVPSNYKGDATGCTEISFTTSTEWTYCPATHTTATGEKISQVVFAGIDNPSTATTGYEDFTAIKGQAKQEGVYPITVTVLNPNNNDKVKVWIDFNQNGLFDNDEETLLTYASGTATGNITVPTGAKLGDTRMRIRMARQGNANNVVACGNISANGQTEDYTVTILEKDLATANVSKAGISVYPNPFVDVLKISDVKNVKSISVSDASGRQVKTLKPSAELNLSSLTAGVYVVTLHMNDGSVKTVKAIKK